MTTKVDSRIAELRLKLKELQGQLERPVIEEAIATKTGDTETAHRASEEVRQISASMAEIGEQIRGIEREEKDRDAWRKLLPRAVSANERIRRGKARGRDLGFLLQEWADEYQEAVIEFKGIASTVDRLAPKFSPGFQLEDIELDHLYLGNEDASLPAVLRAIAGGPDSDGFSYRPFYKWASMRSRMHRNGKDGKQ